MARFPRLNLHNQSVSSQGPTQGEMCEGYHGYDAYTKRSHAQERVVLGGNIEKDVAKRAFVRSDTHGGALSRATGQIGHTDDDPPADAGFSASFWPWQAS